MAGKIAYIFDFDETLVTTTARINVYRNGAHYKSMDSKEYNFYKPNPEDTFDFSDFKDGNVIMNAKKYKMWPVLKNISDAIRDDRSDSEIYILTARAPITQSYIYEYLKSHGIKIKLNHVLTIGDDLGKFNISEEKRKKLMELAKKYTKVVFFDDDPKNISLAAGIEGIKTRLVEAFVEDSDPIKDMGIGMNRLIDDYFARIRREVQRNDRKYSITNPEDRNDMLRILIRLEEYDYADYILLTYNLDIDINNYHLMRIFAFSKDFKSVDYCVSRGADISSALSYAQKRNETETVKNFIKYKQSRSKNMNDTKKPLEEDMGGVSAPISTLNNTPGMGSAVPPSNGNVGSGDTWGNKFNDKPYTQAAGPKKKKKKKPVKKPKLEEENINPYDKIGMAMAKKMGVKTPFKKKKNKKNQNSMVQKKYEHQIITLDEFTQKLYEAEGFENPRYMNNPKGLYELAGSIVSLRHFIHQMMQHDKDAIIQKDDKVFVSINHNNSSLILNLCNKFGIILREAE